MDIKEEIRTTSAVYNRIVKTTFDNDHISLAFNGVLNLTDIQEIRDFVTDYRRFNPSNWQYDISYALEFFDDIDHKKIWFEAVGDIIGINIFMIRSERELYTRFHYVDGKYNTIPNVVNVEAGKHQNKTRYHDILADLDPTDLSEIL